MEDRGLLLQERIACLGLAISILYLRSSILVYPWLIKPKLRQRRDSPWGVPRR